MPLRVKCARPANSPSASSTGRPCRLEYAAVLVIVFSASLVGCAVRPDVAVTQSPIDYQDLSRASRRVSGKWPAARERRRRKRRIRLADGTRVQQRLEDVVLGPSVVEEYGPGIADRIISAR